MGTNNVRYSAGCTKGVEMVLRNAWGLLNMGTNNDRYSAGYTQGVEMVLREA